MLHTLWLWLVEPLQYQFVCRGLLMSVLLGISGGIVGSILLLRRLALMADSFGHCLLPGVGLAYLFFGPGIAPLLGGAVAAGVLTAVLGTLANRLTRLKEDAAFGAFFVITFAAGVALMSRVATPMDLLHYLFGNILAVTANDLWLVASVTSATVFCTLVGYRALVLETFDPAFHRASGGRSLLTHVLMLVLAVLNLISALQSVGMVLALGVFILAPAAAYLWCERFAPMLFLSAVFGGVGGAIGLYVSYHANLPSGPCMVLVLGALFIASALISPRYGLYARLRSAPHRHEDDPMP